MKLLAIETATDACSVALLVDGQTIQDHRVASQQHAALVLPMVEAILSDAQLDVCALDGIVYGRGPGSFTGVRIGVAVTQGMALGADIGVIGISSLQSIAQGCLHEHDDSHVAVSIDARMDEVYFCSFKRDANALMMPLLTERVCKPAKVGRWPATCPKGEKADYAAKAIAPIWAGSGAERYADQLREDFDVQQSQIRAECLPQARDLIALALPLVKLGGLLDAGEASPVYLRDKVAQTIKERVADRLA